jgi:hypothetical protein
MERPPKMIEIHADELQPGDVIEYAGHRHLIALVDRRPGWLWPIATDDSGWAIALDHHVIPVYRTPAQAAA